HSTGAPASARPCPHAAGGPGRGNVGRGQSNKNISDAGAHAECAERTARGRRPDGPDRGMPSEGDGKMTVTGEPPVTTGPHAGRSKAYRQVEGPGGGASLRVPFRRVNLSTGDHFDLYDTSGPYTDPDALIDLKTGLAPRRRVVRDRGTQLQRARAGEITAEMA